MIEIDETTFEREVRDGSLRVRLERELTAGFASMLERGEALPPASYYATKIAELVAAELPSPIPSELAFEMYQEIVGACEAARVAVLGEATDEGCEPRN